MSRWRVLTSFIRGQRRFFHNNLNMDLSEKKNGKLRAVTLRELYFRLLWSKLKVFLSSSGITPR